MSGALAAILSAAAPERRMRESGLLDSNASGNRLAPSLATEEQQEQGGEMMRNCWFTDAAQSGGRRMRFAA